MGDVRLELMSPPATVDEAPAAAARGGAPRGLVVAVAAVLLAGVAALAGLAGSLLTPTPPPPRLPIVDADLALPEGERLAHGYAPGIALSPDGRFVVFASGEPPAVQRSPTDFGGGLRLRRLGSRTTVPILGAEHDGGQPAISPDGAHVAFVRDDRILRLRLPDGEPSLVAELDAPPWGLCWGPDGFIYYGSDVAGVHRVAASGGPAERLTTTVDAPDGSRHYHPHVLPGGRAVLYTNITSSDLGHGLNVWLHDLETGASRALGIRGSQPSYLDGHLLLVDDGVLRAAPFDLDALEVVGPARATGAAVVHAVRTPSFRTNNGSAQYAVSPSGSLVYAEGGTFPSMVRPVAWFDATEGMTEIDLEPGSSLAARLSPGADRMVVTIFGRPESSAWVHDFERGITRRVSGGDVRWPAWGPGDDEITLTFGREHGPGTRIGWLTIGAAESTMRWIDVPEGFIALAAEWSPDRRHLVCAVLDGDQQWAISAWSESDGWERLTGGPSHSEVHPAISPDGRWLAYASDESGRYEVYVRPFLGDGPSIQVTQGGADTPMWTDDMSALRFIDHGARDAEPAVVQLGGVPITQAEGSIAFGRSRAEVEVRGFGRSWPLRPGDLAPDGRLLTIVLPSVAEFEATRRRMHPDTLRYVQSWSTRLEERRGP